MSSEALTWGKLRRVGSTGRKATLLLMCDIADFRGVLWPGGEYLADILECNRSTVVEHLKALRESQAITAVERRKSNGARSSAVIVLAPYSDRGVMLDPRTHPEYGDLIAETLYRDIQPGDSQRGENQRGDFSEPKSGSPTRTNNRTNRGEAKASPANERATARDSIPTGFPEVLKPHLDEVVTTLTEWAAGHNSKAVTRGAVAHVLMARPNRPVVKAAHDCASHFPAGVGGRQVKDAIATYRNWLERAPELASIERLPGAIPAGPVGGNVVRLERPKPLQRSDSWTQFYPDESEAS